MIEAAAVGLRGFQNLGHSGVAIPSLPKQPAARLDEPCFCADCGWLRPLVGRSSKSRFGCPVKGLRYPSPTNVTTPLPPETADAVGRSAVQRINRRLIPFLFLLYVVVTLVGEG